MALREAVEDAENAALVLEADAQALKRDAQEEEQEEEEAAEQQQRSQRLEAALLASRAARALSLELGWMRRVVRGASASTPAASAQAALDMWRLQPFTDDDLLEALVGGAARLAAAAAE